MALIPLPFNGGRISNDMSVSFAWLICSMTVIVLKMWCKLKDAGGNYKRQVEKSVVSRVERVG
jgi:hypothetical protein